MNDKTILITGSSGFIGSALFNAVKGLFPLSRAVGLDARPGVAGTAVLDLLQKEAVARAIEGIRPDFVFHMAGVIYSKDWEEHCKGNILATANLLDALASEGIHPRIIVPGSAAEYGRGLQHELPVTEGRLPYPVTPYGVGKLWQTTLARYYAGRGMDIVIGRMFNVIGRGMPQGLSAGSFARQINDIRQKATPPVMHVGNLSAKRDFIDINDACRALVALAEKGVTGEAYNICSGRSCSIKELLDLMIRESGLEVKVVQDAGRMKDSDIDEIYGSYEKISTLTGWTPRVPLLESVRELLAWP